MIEVCHALFDPQNKRASAPSPEKKKAEKRNSIQNQSVASSNLFRSCSEKKNPDLPIDKFEMIVSMFDRATLFFFDWRCKFRSETEIDD